MRNPSVTYRDAPVTVSFPVPKKAASKLRSLAISKDRRLLDLGVLAVQINEGESIVLGIKLGRRRLKTTEEDSDKLRGNPSAGRVAKRQNSACRNAATIHHMPGSSQAQRLSTTEIRISSSKNNQDNSSKRAAQPNGDVLADELFSDSSPGRTAKKPSSGGKNRGSDYTSSFDASVLSLNGQSKSSLARETTLKQQDKYSSYATERSFNRTGSSMQKITQGLGKTKTQTPSVKSPVGIKPARLISDKESSLSSARRLSSPASLRAYSASPGSDTSSTSSEENLDAQQLIYSCFVDRSKYSAADMLKQLAEAHESKKDTAVPTATNTTKPSAATSKSRSCDSSLSDEQKMPGSKKRPAVPGSYREHVKNIRCNSLTSQTTTTSTVNSRLKSQTSSKLQTLGLQSSIGNTEKLPGFRERKVTMQDTVTHVSQSTPSTASQTKSMKTGSTQTPAFRGGRKVLWSGTNALPSSANLSAHQSVSQPTTVSPKVTSSNILSLHSQVPEATITFSSSCMKSETTMCNDAAKSIPSDTHFSFHTSNKVSGQQSVIDCRMSQNDSKTVIVKTPTLPSKTQESVTLSAISSSQVATTTSNSLPCDSSIANITQTESQGSPQLVQNLTLARSTLPPANVVLPGTNTQTTWSNPQVSPTYFVGTQAQYGVYPALYSTDANNNNNNNNNNQLGQQAMTATYPLNYVYPISFVYPYLSMAQTNSVKNVNVNKVKQQNEDTEAVVDTASKANEGKSKPDVTMPTDNGNMVNLQSMQSSVSSAAPVQTQFIDLASSMRYWQQLSLLYRSRWQALASCNLSNVTSMTSTLANATATATSVAADSLKTVANGETTVASSNSDLPSYPAKDNSRANPAKDSYYGGHKPTSELCAEISSSAASSYSELPSYPGKDISQSNPAKDSHYGSCKPTSELQAETSLSEILQRVKSEIISEEQSSKAVTSDRPSVIVASAAACKDSRIEMPRSSCMEMTVQPKIEEFERGKLPNTNERKTVLNSFSYGTSSTSEEEIDVPRLHHHSDKLRHMAKENVGRRSFRISTPKLSFIHDSSIACVNIGNSNGNGYGYANSMQHHPEARRPSLGIQTDSTVRPAKRKKTKRSL